MIKIELNVDPVPWTPSRIVHGHAYNPKEAEKRATQYLIAQQYKDQPLDCYIRIYMVFTFKIPVSASKKKREAMIHHKIIPTRSDCTNHQKFYEDCLKKIVITDDRNVEYISSQKLYGERGLVTIWVTTRE
jgi:Holliday junction resolvase RusA-like endonuclease